VKPKLSSKTPDNSDINSLIIQHEYLIEHFNSPDATNRHIAIVEYGVDRVVAFEGGDEQATIVTRQIELMTGANQDAAEQLLLAVYGTRTGNKMLPAADTNVPLDLSGIDPVADAAEQAQKDAEFEKAAPKK
jgi:hypothetical protein